MRSGTRSWKQVTAEVLAFLSELDPYRLDPGMPEGAPKDEYAPEADAIARHLLSHGTIEAKQVDAIWQHWFGESLSHVISAGDRDKFIERLNRLMGTTGQAVTDAAAGSKNNG